MQNREANLKHREANLKNREANLKNREANLKNREASLQNREASLQNREASLQTREANLQNRTGPRPNPVARVRRHHPSPSKGRAAPGLSRRHLATHSTPAPAVPGPVSLSVCH